MLGSSLLISALFTISHAANLVEVLTKHGATKLVDLAVKAGLADTLTGEQRTCSEYFVQLLFDPEASYTFFDVQIFPYFSIYSMRFNKNSFLFMNF